MPSVFDDVGFDDDEEIQTTPTPAPTPTPRPTVGGKKPPTEADHAQHESEESDSEKKTKKAAPAKPEAEIAEFESPRKFPTGLDGESVTTMRAFLLKDKRVVWVAGDVMAMMGLKEKTQSEFNKRIPLGGCVRTGPKGKLLNCFETETAKAVAKDYKKDTPEWTILMTILDKKSSPDIVSAPPAPAAPAPAPEPAPAEAPEQNGTEEKVAGKKKKKPSSPDEATAEAEPKKKKKAEKAAPAPAPTPASTPYSQALIDHLREMHMNAYITYRGAKEFAARMGIEL